MIEVETQFICLAMDEDGIEGTIEDKREHPGHCVLDGIEACDVANLFEWCKKVGAALETTHKNYPGALDEDDLDALKRLT